MIKIVSILRFLVVGCAFVALLPPTVSKDVDTPSEATLYHNSGLRIGIDRDSMFALLRSEIKDVLDSQTPIAAGDAQGGTGPSWWRYEYKFTNTTIHSFAMNLDTLEFELLEPNIIKGVGHEFQCDVDFDYQTNSWVAGNGRGLAEVRDVDIYMEITLEREDSHFSTTMVEFRVDIGSIGLDLGDNFGDGLAEWVISFYIDDITASVEKKVEAASYDIWKGVVDEDVKRLNTTPYFKEVAYGIDISPSADPVIKEGVLDVVLVGEVFAPQSDRSLFQPDDNYSFLEYNYGRKGIQIRVSDHLVKSFNWTWFNDKDNNSHEFPIQIPTHYSEGSGFLQLKDILPRANRDDGYEYEDFLLILKLVEEAPDFHYSKVNTLAGTLTFEVEVSKGTTLENAVSQFGVIMTVDAELEPFPVGSDHIGATILKAEVTETKTEGDRIGSELLKPMAQKVVPFIKRYLQGRIFNEGFDMNFLPELTVTGVEVSVVSTNLVIQLDTIYNPDA